ncbi:MAG: T9SS type A sorting domain-containing protein [Saprospiraceae bacterium]|nr:T9SS type A sorting domain-containing protein [Saprospiraceae bacterium]
MRIFSTLICMLMLAAAASAQFVLVNSPSGIAGSKAFSAAGFGADLTTGVWTADIVFINDGSANPTQGCVAAINGADLAGKIAVVDRGTCEFGLKCLNAEQAGAIAVVVLNNAANAGLGTIVMGAGAVGANVTVPAVMLSYEDGEIIRAEMATGPVNMTIGNIQFANDMRIASDRIFNYANGVIPANQVDAGAFAFTPGASVLNRGLEDASGITLQATITHTPFGGSTATGVYDESNSLAFLDNDSAQVIALPAYVPSEGAGIYSVTYNVSASVDDSPEVNNDQEVTTQFVLSNNVYCKGRWDLANNRPLNTNAFRRGAGTEVEFLAAFPIAKGLGYKLDSLQFYISSDSTLNKLPAGALQAYVYEWDDINGDVFVSTDEFTIVGYSEINLADQTGTNAWLKLPIVDYVELEGPAVIPGDNKQYVLGIRYRGAINSFIGFDEGYDHTAYLDDQNAVIGFTNDIELPYFLISAWDDNLNLPDLASYGLFTDNAASLAAALYVNEYESSTQDLNKTMVNITMSPNPTSNVLTVESQFANSTKYVTYLLRDNMGRLVASQQRDLNSNYDKTTFDVSQLTAGQYFVIVQTEEGFKGEWFTVQH